MNAAERERRHRTLLAALDEASQLLTRHGETRWATWLATDRDRLEQHDESAIAHVLAALGGMGSLSDLIFHPLNDNADSEAEGARDTAELGRLRRIIYEEADALQRHVDATSGQSADASQPWRRDWIDWHRGYEDPSSAHSRRLTVVRQRVAEALGSLGGRAARIVSLCAGDGRDLIPVLAGLPRHRRPAAVLVEKNRELAARAARQAERDGVDNVRVITGDAGDPTVFGDALPADVLMLCGIFGNIAQQDITATINAVPALTAPEGLVIWTRGPSEPDLRPHIRRWFTEAGLRETAYDGDPEPFGVGVARLPAGWSDEPGPLPPRLFTFVR